ncbi:MAG TPA: bifunctional 2-polyprenyl-6-hydroxyphenol methylase/3-demethylubiquinol 3-O-methyltransferase UbiG [Candidatus Sulfotelmatobacter sp.]|nr:bifunctional 2-polyprenyl-6-hydroxyphenol methylase/3-demethylubiquinol 3-O-methyltransferase UbiG [Candidatus Sulfotelmatobacter sp.]
MQTTPGALDSASVDPDEVARFAALADDWWDPTGRFRPLHRFNPVRLSFIRDRLIRHFHRDTAALEPLTGLRVLDIGCGGGLVAEPIARLGATVVGIDATAKNVEVARRHAAEAGLAIDYRCASAETLVAEGARFDVILNLEVVEHVVALEPFIGACGKLAAPGGAMIVATLNRTAKAWALAIVGAEYVLGWLPRGTHRWEKFVRPSELAAALRRSGFEIGELAGVGYNPLAGEWSLSRDLAVNYMVFARFV